MGNLIWEDNFNTFNTNIWNPITGNGCEIGLCGWGNVELEYYSENNISIEKYVFFTLPRFFTHVIGNEHFFLALL